MTCSFVGCVRYAGHHGCHFDGETNYNTTDTWTPLGKKQPQIIFSEIDEEQLAALAGVCRRLDPADPHFEVRAITLAVRV